MNINDIVEFGKIMKNLKEKVGNHMLIHKNYYKENLQRGITGHFNREFEFFDGYEDINIIGIYEDYGKLYVSIEYESARCGYCEKREHDIYLKDLLLTSDEIKNTLIDKDTKGFTDNIERLKKMHEDITRIIYQHRERLKDFYDEFTTSLVKKDLDAKLENIQHVEKELKRVEEQFAIFLENIKKYRSV